MVGAAGELVPPNDEARRPQELSDGFIVLALDALEATVWRPVMMVRHQVSDLASQPLHLQV